MRAILGLALALAPAGTAAQQPRTAAELEGEIARLTPIYLEARRASEAAERARARLQAAATTQATVQVGPLRIVTTLAEVEDVRRLWTEQWARYEAITRSRTEALERITFIHHVGAARSFTVQGETRQVVFRGLRPATEAAVRAEIRQVLGVAVDETLPFLLRSGWDAAPVGATVPLDVIYEQLASAPLTLSQACFQGDVDACWRGLGQMDPSASVVETWLTPSEQRSAAWRLAPGEVNPRVRERCLAGDGDACQRAVFAASLMTQPLPASARASIIWLALERGGEGALDRLWRSWGSGQEGLGGAGNEEELLDLVERKLGAAERQRVAGILGTAYGNLGDPRLPAYIHIGPLTDVRTHLAVAAQMDPDALMREWLAGLHAARPRPPEPTQGDRTTALLWLGLFAVLAARSTRWRFA